MGGFQPRRWRDDWWGHICRPWIECSAHQRAAPIAFFLAGIVALTTAYSYAKLSLRYPSEGETIEFLTKAFGTGLFSGGMNILLLISYVIMMSLYAYAFGSYAANALGIPLLRSIFVTFVILLFTILNAYGAVVSGRAEDLLVAFKITVLMAVVGAGIALVRPERLMPPYWADTTGIVAGGMIIFLAYEGFELIANAGGDVEHPRVLSKAFYASVILVMLIYIFIAIITVGTLPYDKIVQARDYALAIAAEPSLGKFGFWLVTFAALASTSSAINATLYGTARASYMVAKFGQLPHAIERRVWRQAYEGLVVVSLLSVILSNTANLETIATAGSGGFLLVFFAVNLAALKLRNKTRLNPVIPSLGAAMALSAFTILVLRIMKESTYALSVMFTLIAVSFLSEWAYRLWTGREIESYIDRKLRKREENIRTWNTWIPGVLDEIGKRFDDSEVYIVGSVARGEVENANDVDLLILTDKAEKVEKETITREIRNKAGLTPQHCVDLHFERKSLKNEALKKAKEYRRLR